jgi:hypothetical protein
LGFSLLATPFGVVLIVLGGLHDPGFVESAVGGGELAELRIVRSLAL